MQGKHGKEKEMERLHSHASSPLLTRYDYSTALYFAEKQPKHLTQPHFMNQPTIWDYNKLLYFQRKKKTNTKRYAYMEPQAESVIACQCII